MIIWNNIWNIIFIKINNFISNNKNVFNITPLGIHTLGLVKISEIKPLNKLDYGNTFWESIGVFNKETSFPGDLSEIKEDEGNEEGIRKKKR